MLNTIPQYFEIPQLNSLRFAESVVWNNYDKPKKLDNTLSYQEDGENNKQFFQLFQFNDAIRIQFRSSYSTNLVNIHGCDETVTPISPVKRTSNLDVVDLRNAGIVEHETFTAVFFGEGNILDPITEDIIGPDESGEYVPEWLVVGKNIILRSTQEYEVTITAIIWLESQEKYAIVTDELYSTFSPSTSLFVKSQYNKEDYEIYEFDIDFYGFAEGKYQVEILAQDDNFDNKTFLSERIDLRETQEETHLIVYENGENNNINYTWGIQHMLRLPYENQLSYSPSGENEVHNTDNNTILIDSTNYETYEVHLKPVPTAIAVMLSLVFSQKNLFIDTKSYVSGEKPEVEKLNYSNLYNLKVKVTLSNETYVNRNIDFASMPDASMAHILVDGGYLKLGSSVPGLFIIN